jgi:hypothetical protein
MQTHNKAKNSKFYKCFEVFSKVRVEKLLVCKEPRVFQNLLKKLDALSGEYLREYMLEGTFKFRICMRVPLRFTIFKILSM